MTESDDKFMDSHSLTNFQARASMIMLKHFTGADIKYVINKWVSVKHPQGLLASHMCSLEPLNNGLMELVDNTPCPGCGTILTPEIIILIQLEAFKGL